MEETTLRSFACKHTCGKRLKGGGRRGRRRRRRLHGGWRRLLRRRSGLALDLAHGERQSGSGRRRRPPSSSLPVMVGRGENDRAAEFGCNCNAGLLEAATIIIARKLRPEFDKRRRVPLPAVRSRERRRVARRERPGPSLGHGTL